MRLLRIALQTNLFFGLIRQRAHNYSRAAEKLQALVFNNLNNSLCGFNQASHNP